MWNWTARRHVLAIRPRIALIRSCSFLAVFLSLCSTPVAHATTLTNGNFDTDLTGWTTSAGINSSTDVILSGASRAAVIGTAGGDTAGTFSQNFTLADSGLVDYSFSAGRSESACGCNDVPLTFGVRIDGNILSTVLPIFDVAGSNGSFHITQLTNYFGSLFLSAGSHELAFEFSRGFNLFGRAPYFVLDGVSLSPQVASTETPVPAALPLFATGLGVLGFLARRKRKAVAA